MLLNEAGTRALCLVDTVKHRSRAAYGLSGKITRLKQKAGGASIAAFKLDETVVFAQSEELPLVERPLPYPLFGTTLAVTVHSEQLAPKQAVAVTGKRQRLEVRADDAALQFHTDVGADVPVKPGDSFVLVGEPRSLNGTVESAIVPGDLVTLQADLVTVVRWRLADRDGREGTLDATFAHVKLAPAAKNDPEVSELATIDDELSAVVPDRDGTVLTLAAALHNVYDRATAKVCANLALATHGESVGEAAGSGKADTPSQAFALRQKPLTWVSAATPSGRESTLEVRVDGLLWTEVESLFERGPRERVYALTRDDDHVTTVRFGDGMEGARLPSGQDNVRFAYRKGLGIAGNLAAGRLTTLLSRPLGVKSASNPAPAAGGQDPEALEDARANAPLGMLTLGRAVSLQDYADLARTFAGIARAQAVWIGTGLTRGIFVTVAGVDGAAVEADSDTLVNLVDALRKYGDPLVRLHVATYAAPIFTLTGSIKVAPDALADEVMPQVEAALRDFYAFANRDFGQTVSIDEVMAVIHSVTGVEAADIDTLQRVETGAVSSPRLFAWPARVADDGTLLAAELLTLDPGPLELEVMP
jgi:predicted phage baseplate assembly protein